MSEGQDVDDIRLAELKKEIQSVEPDADAVARKARSDSEEEAFKKLDKFRSPPPSPGLSQSKKQAALTRRRFFPQTGQNGFGPKVALITGVTGQDGSYLAEFLLAKGYVVHGLKRRASSFNQARVEHLFENPDENPDTRFFAHYGDLTDLSDLIRVMRDIKPDEVYNLAAQSHVKVSFEMPIYTAETDGIGTLNLLEAVRTLDMFDKVRFYQASTSELYGSSPPPRDESTPFHPRSPYACAKLMAYWCVVNYREAYDMYACNGVLFNHESPRRGATFVTRKITMSVANIYNGKQKSVVLGNLDARRDWGHAKDYVEAMWLMLQQDECEDYVIATGESHSVREFCEIAFGYAGMPLKWEGTGVDEIGIDTNTGNVLVRVDPRYFRPSEVEHLEGNPTKSRKKLGWKPKYTFKELVEDMIKADMA